MSQNKILFDVCRMGNVFSLERLLQKKKINISALDDHGNGVLHYACQSKIYVLELLTLLIEAGASPDVKNDEGNTPLHFLCYISPSYRDVMHYLIKHGAPVNDQNKYGMTPLHVLFDRRLRLQEQYPTKNTNSIECQRFLRTFLFYDSIKLLLNHKADCNLANCFGDTPVHTLARLNSYEEILELLVKYKSNLNFLNHDAKTPLHILCEKKNLNVILIKSMLSNGASLYISGNSITPLHILCTRKPVELDLIKRFINKQESAENTIDNERLSHSLDFLSLFNCRQKTKKKKLQLNLPSMQTKMWPIDEISLQKEREALSLLLKNRCLDYETVQFLVTKKVNFNHQDVQGNTFLHLISTLKTPNPKIIALLLESKLVDPNIQNKSGLTAFHFLISRSYLNENLCLLFLKNHADPNLQNKYGESPFHLLCAHKKTQFNLLRLFFEYKANPNIPNNHGETAFHLFSGNQQLSFTTAQLFFMNQANPNLETKLGFSVLDILIKQKYSFVALLYFMVHGSICYQDIPITTDQYQSFSLLMTLMRHLGGVEQLIDELLKNNPKGQHTRQSISFSKENKALHYFNWIAEATEEELSKLETSLN